MLNDGDRIAGQLTRAAVELAKLWRNDKYLRKLDVGHTCWCKAEETQAAHTHSPTMFCRLSW